MGCAETLLHHIERIPGREEGRDVELHEPRGSRSPIGRNSALAPYFPHENTRSPVTQAPRPLLQLELARQRFPPLFNSAMSSTKRYFTSPFTSRSYASFT